MSSVICRMMSWRSCRVSGVFSTASTSVTTSLTFSSRSASVFPSWLKRRGPRRGMISLWTRVFSSANGSATTEARSAASLASFASGSSDWPATWIRECSDIVYLPSEPLGLLLLVGRRGAHRDELVRDLTQRLDDAGARVGQCDRHAAVDRDRHVALARHLELDLHVEGPLHLARPQADLGAGAVEQQVAALLGVVQEVERLKRELDVLDRRHVERRDEQELVGAIERREHRAVKERRGVDDDDVVALLGDREQVAEALLGHELGILGAKRGREDVHAGLVSGDVSRQSVGVELATCHDEVIDRLLGLDAHHDGRVAELEIQVEEQRAPLLLARKDDREVRGQDGLAGAALG